MYSALVRDLTSVSLSGLMEVFSEFTIEITCKLVTAKVEPFTIGVVFAAVVVVNIFVVMGKLVITKDEPLAIVVGIVVVVVVFVTADVATAIVEIIGILVSA